MTDERLVREELSEGLSAEEFTERLERGWIPRAIEWRTGDADAGADASPEPERSEVPYGQRVANDGYHLEESPEEMATLTRMLQLLVDDEPLWRVAEQLNAEGHRMRSGDPWRQTTVFELLPRLVEVAPKLFGSRSWAEWRRERPRRIV